MNATRSESGAGIRPFPVSFNPDDVADLRRRIEATRLPERETVDDFSQGVPLDTARKVVAYWANEYDWGALEKKLSDLPNFITEIDGLDIHFIHVRSKVDGALPVLIAHGWPGSVVEQLKLVGPLVDPASHGGREEDAFDVVIPSMPGYGFSGKPTRTGWNPQRIARAYDVLMKRLGYTTYVAHGGDWGAIVVDQMAVQAPDGLLAIHTNMPCVVPPEIDTAALAGKPAPDGLSADERQAYDQLAAFYKDVYYAFFMGTRPQTLTGLSDSPIALATFMMDHDRRSLELIARSFDGVPEGLTRDDVLDNVTLFWLTDTGVSAARLYWENKLPFFQPKGVALPVIASAFPDELFQAPESWTRKAYPKLIRYRRLPKGCHFAAWEQPESLYTEMREGFREIRH